jgi:hypothetical protein
MSNFDRYGIPAIGIVLGVLLWWFLEVNGYHKGYLPFFF